MYESFIASLNVVAPMMLLMALGSFSRINGMITREAMKQFDRVIFKIFMPVMLFRNIYDMDFTQGFAVREMIFAAVCLTILFALSLTIPKFITNDGNKSSVIGQALLRCNYLLCGVVVVEALYGEGNTRVVVMLGMVVIPAINIFSAIILELNRSGSADPLKLFIAVLKTPLIVGAILGFAFRLLNIPIILPVWSVIRSVASSTTTVSFFSLGAGLNMASLQSDIKPLIWAIFLRMFIVPVIFMPLSVIMGFRGQSLCAMMVVFAAPTAVASYPMAVAMGADGDLAGQIVCATTVLSVITIFLWTLLLKTFSLL